MTFMSKISIIQDKDFDFFLEVSKYRTPFMGVAMLFVLIFHAMCSIYNPLGYFNIGYVGVDIFLFLSGFGLTFSYFRNTCFTFYKHRFIRLYPLYFFCICICFIFNYKWNYSNFIYNLLTVGFYVDNGIYRFDWYVESLFTLYLLFPLFFIYSKLRLFGIIILLLCCSVILYLFKFSWWYECLISRIPIFVFGIVCARYKFRTRIFLIMTIISILCFLPTYHFISRFLATSFLVLPILFILIFILKKINKILLNSLSMIGKHTLEIYLTNVLILMTFELYDFTRLFRVIFYLFVQIFVSYLMVGINNLTNKLFVNKTK